MKMTNTGNSGIDVPQVLLRLDDADQRERARPASRPRRRRARAAARRRSAARPRAARRSARTCSRDDHPAISTPITETLDIAITKKMPTSRFEREQRGAERQHHQDRDVRDHRDRRRQREDARGRRRSGTTSSFWMNFTPSATSWAHPWNAPGLHRPEARLHVREDLVLDVADDERHDEEEQPARRTVFRSRTSQKLPDQRVEDRGAGLARSLAPRPPRPRRRPATAWPRGSSSGKSLRSG